MAAALDEAGIACELHPWLPGCFLVSGTGNLESLPLFQSGAVYVQDAAAKLAVLASGAAPGMTPDQAAAMLRSALELSNSAVSEQSQLSDDFTAMGTTLVAAWISRDLAVVINVGDSRAYHFTREDVRLITRDHSMVAYMVERGELTQEQAKLHPGKNVITRAVGTEPEVEGDVFTCRLRRDECILLCSDGLSNEMADQEMLFEVVHGLSKSDCCQRLLHIAKNRGAPDNVTVTLAAV